MALFPSIAPVYPAPKKSIIQLSKTQLGDGYSARHVFGLNAVKPEWSLEWLVSQENADIIDVFLQTCADSAEAFEWQPPDASYALDWRCDEWSVEQQSYNLYSIKAIFKRVFEPVTLEVIAEPAICPPETVCGSDAGRIIPIPDKFGGIILPDTVLTVADLPRSPYTCTIQWTRDGVAIPGATGTSYTVSVLDIGYTIGIIYTCGPTSETIILETIPGIPALYWPTAFCGNAYFEYGSIESWSNCLNGATGGGIYGPIASAFPSNYVCGNYMGTRTVNFCSGGGGYAGPFLPGAMKYEAGCNTPRCWPRNGMFVAGTSPTSVSRVQDIWGSNTGNPIGRSSKSSHSTIITAFVLQGNVPGLGVHGENVYDKLVESALDTFGLELPLESEGF